MSCTTCNKNVLELASEKGRSAVERITPLVDQAVTKVTPYVDQAVIVASDAGRRAAGFTADRIEQIQPSLGAALDRVAPAVDRVQHAFQESVVPQVVESLRTVSSGQTGEQARALFDGLTNRSDASLAAFQTELAKAQQAGVIKKVSKTKTILTVAAIGAVVAAVAVAVKTFLGSREDWAAYEPDEPYVYPDDDPRSRLSSPPLRRLPRLRRSSPSRTAKAPTLGRTRRTASPSRATSAR